MLPWEQGLANDVPDSFSHNGQIRFTRLFYFTWANKLICKHWKT